MVNKLDYLKLIQDVISRMANNSFLLKGWSITLASGIFGLFVINDIGFVYYQLFYLLLIVFWVLDSYYLRQERLYRGLYDRVRKKNEAELNKTNYSMIPPKKGDKDYDEKKYSFWNVLFSKTEAGLYLCLIGILSLMILIFSLSQCNNIE